MLKRQKQVSLRLTEKEYALLCKQAKAAYLKREPYIRRLIEGCHIVPRRPDEYLPLVKNISAVGKRINEITHEANRTCCITEAQFTELEQLLREILRMVQEGLGG